MPSLWGAFSSPSSASSSPSNSPQKFKKGSLSFGWPSLKSSTSSKRRLTRQRKLRYIGDDEVGLCPQSMPVSPDASDSRLQTHWSKSAVPQPLPLPSARSSNRETPLNATDTATRRPRTPTYKRRGLFQVLQVERIEPKFRIHVPTRSAPSSGFSSPVLSPKRYSTGDLFNSDRRASVLDGTPLERVSRSSAASPSKVTVSADHSPLHSQFQQPGKNIWNYNGIQHSHHKSLPESYSQCHDNNNANLHRLPLPPVASRPSQSTPSHHHVDNLETTTVKGEWQKGKLIGRGTYGSVYIATNRETGALCAMKVVDIVPDDPKCVESMKQLEQEIKVLQQLKHPNIVQYYGSEIIDDRFCIYLEYVHPGSINNYVKEHCGAMTERVVRSFTCHILSGLAYLHSMKTIHRDIKGPNLLVNASGIVKIADFGLAKHLTGHTINLSLKGSPHWMAPEVLQAVMRKDANPDLACAVDIWSLGCTVIEMLTGKPPWSEFSPVQAMFNVLNRTPPIPEALTSEGKDFLKKCLQRDPTNRPSAVELLEHPFVQNLRVQHIASLPEDFSGIKLQDTPNSPKDSSKHSIENIHDKLTHNGETPPQSHPEIPDSAAVSCPSPCSTLEILPCITSLNLNGSSNKVSSLSVLNFRFARSGNNPLVSLRNQGRQTLHF